MADNALYWPNYLGESGADGEPVTSWYTSREHVVKRLRRGDRLWLFVAGDAIEDAEDSHRAYVAQLMVVDEWRDNPDYDPDVKGSSRFVIIANEDRCILVQPPLLVDHIFRQSSAGPEHHIGLIRQTPFVLDGSQEGEMLGLLREHRPDVYKVATQA
jgi:hypothetical protein